MFKNESKTKLFVQVSQRHIISGFKSKEVCLSPLFYFNIESPIPSPHAGNLLKIVLFY